MKKIDFSSKNCDLIGSNYSKNGFIFLNKILTYQEVENFNKILTEKFKEILDVDYNKILRGDLQKISSKNIDKIRAEINYRSKIFEKVPERVFMILSEIYKKKVVFFPVNKVRINIPEINTRTFDWHQDEATWPELRNIGCHTIWVSLTH